MAESYVTAPLTRGITPSAEQVKKNTAGPLGLLLQRQRAGRGARTGVGGWIVGVPVEVSGGSWIAHCTIPGGIFLPGLDAQVIPVSAEGLIGVKARFIRLSL